MHGLGGAMTAIENTGVMLAACGVFAVGHWLVTAIVRWSGFTMGGLWVYPFVTAVFAGLYATSAGPMLPGPDPVPRWVYFSAGEAILIATIWALRRLGQWLADGDPL